MPLAGKSKFLVGLEDDDPVFEPFDRMRSVRATVEALRADVATILEHVRGAGDELSDWLTLEEALALLPVGETRLRELARERGHLPGGPVDISSPGARSVFRFQRSTLDDWLRRACTVKPLEKQSPAKPRRGQRRSQSPDPMKPVNWKEV